MMGGMYMKREPNNVTWIPIYTLEIFKQKNKMGKKVSGRGKVKYRRLDIT